MMHDEAIKLLKRSAKGDMQAHRCLAELAMGLGLEAVTNGDDATLPYYEASIYARMAAASGLLPDRARLISILAVCSDIARQSGDLESAEVYNAEGLALAELVADSGDAEASEYAAMMITNSGTNWSPDEIAMAKEFKIIWGAE